jgi:hypothetical protein
VNETEGDIVILDYPNQRYIFHNTKYSDVSLRVYDLFASGGPEVCNGRHRNFSNTLLVLSLRYISKLITSSFGTRFSNCRSLRAIGINHIARGTRELSARMRPIASAVDALTPITYQDNQIIGSSANNVLMFVPFFKH